MKKLCSCLLFLLSISVNAQGLAHDSTFGNMGVASTNVDFYNSYLLENHKIISCNGDKMVRYNENGSIDTSFGINGECLTTVGYNRVYFDNGFIYTAGFSYPNPSAVKVHKYDGDGHLVSSFGINGMTSYTPDESSSDYRLLFTSDHKILLSGIKYSSPWHKLFIVKFNRDGSIDTTFQNNGFKEYYIFPIETSNIADVVSNNDDTFTFACIGRVNRFSQYRQLALVKMDAQGNLVTGFNGTGIKMFPTMTYEYFECPKFLGTNTLYVMNAGDFYPDAYLLKINLTDFTIQNTLTVYRNTTDYIVNDDGSIITYNFDDYWAGVFISDVHINKYTPAGTSDPTFGNTGFNLYDYNNPNITDRSSQIFMYDNKMLITGRSQLYQTTGPDNYLTYFNRFDLVPLELSVDNPAIDNKVVISPNPVLNDLNISVNGLSFPLTASIYNQLGQLVNEIKYVNGTETSLNIQTGNLPASIYNLVLTDGNHKRYARKFIKQ